MSPQIDDLAAVRRIVLKYLGHWPVRVYLLDSRTRGGAVPGSDIDIALLPEGDMPVDWLAGLREQLEASMCFAPSMY